MILVNIILWLAPLKFYCFWFQIFFTDNWSQIIEKFWVNKITRSKRDSEIYPHPEKNCVHQNIWVKTFWILVQNISVISVFVNVRQISQGQMLIGKMPLWQFYIERVQENFLKIRSALDELEIDDMLVELGFC